MKNIKTSILIAATLSLTFVSCKKETKESIKDVSKEEKVVAQKIPGIQLENMDKTIKPTEDFYRYTNGKWDERTLIPEDRVSWGSFAELRKKTDLDMLAILDDAIANKNYKAGSDQEKAVTLYENILNIDLRNKQGITPVKSYLDAIEKIKTKEDIKNYININANLGLGNPFYSFYISNDLKDSKANAFYLNSGNTGLSRDYYVDTDADTKEKLKSYETFISVLFQKFGEDKATAEKNAKIVVDLETKLASATMTKEEGRDARKRYNPMTVAALQKSTSVIEWDAYFKGVGITKIDKVIVTDVKYMKALNNLYKNASVETVKTLFRWGIINTATKTLTEELNKLHWDFYSKTLTGAKKQRPIKERALGTVNNTVGEALGQLYVEKKFPRAAKEKAKEMIANVRKGFEVRINQLSWMSSETKKKALQKLNKLTVKIAYPDKWKDYSKLTIKSFKNGGSYFDNLVNLYKWYNTKNIAKLGKPVDRTEWSMSPQTVNAYFNPTNNEIVFPAAILQPPFYNYQADEAVNYGGIGAVIGHEISHSFDDSGARFDGDGNLNNWWTESDAKEFKKAGAMLIKQFSDVEVLKGVHVNGDFTLGENIGDLGGIQSSYEGLKIFLAKNGTPKKIDGFTAQQRFFLSWATVWRTKLRDDALKNKIKTDPHSPGFLRAYMPLQNVDSFYEAFDIKEGDKMYLKPEERVRIW